jgi:hypothetical protein
MALAQCIFSVLLQEEEIGHGKWGHLDKTQADN